MKTTIVHHSADFDGLFCREIARKFLPDSEFVGWDFADSPLDDSLLRSEQLIVLDLPVDRPFGLQFKGGWICKGSEQVQPIDRWESKNIIWIDHHKSAIESHPADIPGYRIDGVAACRLAWQWFEAWGRYLRQSNPDMRDMTWFCSHYPFPKKGDFIDRKVAEPVAVRLAGEYDIWDKRDPNAELFQHGLRSRELLPGFWDGLLSDKSEQFTDALLAGGLALQYAREVENASIIKSLGFTFSWEGLTWLGCNAARYNSHLFVAGLKPEHDACFGFKWTGKEWSVSLYHAPGKEHHDLSVIAVKHGGGGHRGACGFVAKELPFLKT